MKSPLVVSIMDPMPRVTCYLWPSLSKVDGILDSNLFQI